MSNQEMLVLGILFIVLLGIQVLILRSLKNSYESEAGFDSNQFNEIANKLQCI